MSRDGKEVCSHCLGTKKEMVFNSDTGKYEVEDCRHCVKGKS